MKRLLEKLDNIEIYILNIAFPLMVLFIFLATVFRYLGIGSITWAEEASRYLMIWLAFAGIGLGFKHNAHLGLSFVVNLLPKPLQKAAYYLRAVLIILFGGIVFYYSYLVVVSQMNNGQLSPSLGIPVWSVYASLLLGSALIVIRTLQLLIKPPTSPDDERLNSQL
ncbi:TRAP transporter small permease [Bacillus sp. B15-48]|uniref:TRAP transporter small permease n=1 Tax=Bacillus sp. B15-48 TaxID=1548601 RepID=UPI00193EC64E|nr:TRAP transporter small permease [Bacillus sp. B15-48]